MKTIGVIGLGSIGMRHAKNLKAMGHNVIGFDPIMIGDGFPSMWPVKRLNEVDGVIIANPTNQHVVELIETPSHVPVFMEKPVGCCLGDAMYLGQEDILALGVHPLDQIKMVGYNLRFCSCVKKAKEWLDAGLIGRPLWSNFTLGQYSEKEPYLRDGCVLNWSHEIDLCTYLLGPAVVATSSTRLTDGKDDMTDILLTHKNGCRSTVHLDYITKPEIRQFMVGCDDGTLKVNLVARTATLKQYVGGEVVESLTEDFSGEDSWNDNYIEEMQAFLDRIDGKETIGCTGEEGLEVLKICLEVRKQAGLA